MKTWRTEVSRQTGVRTGVVWRQISKGGIRFRGLDGKVKMCAVANEMHFIHFVSH